MLGLLFGSSPNGISLASLSTLSHEITTSLVRTIEVNQNANAGYDVLAQGSATRVLTYLYGPLFYDIRGLLFILASFENLILVIKTMIIIRPPFLKSIKKKKDIFTHFLLFYALIGVTLLAQFTSNYGISMRQKTMFYPCLIFFFIFSLKQLFDQNKSKPH